jgi:sigma-E factor negative regulatory protein RseC
MIEEKAIVTGVVDDLAMIQMQRQSACSHCELSRGCGTGALGRLLGHRSRPLTISNKYSFKTGDRLVIGMPDKAFLNASLLIYGLPLLGMMAGGLLAQWLFGKSEMVTIILAISGFACALAYLAYIARGRFSRQFNPVILKYNGEPKG